MYVYRTYNTTVLHICKIKQRKVVEPIKSIKTNIVILIFISCIVYVRYFFKEIKTRCVCSKRSNL